MNDDPLDRATAAYRRATHEDPSDRGIERLERALARPPAPRRLARWVVMPLAAALLVGTAWATGGRVRSWLVPTTEDLVDAPRIRPRIGRAPARDTPSPEGAAPAPTAAESVAPESVATAPRPVSRAAREEVDLDALYRRAHTAQFTARDSKAALAAWDRYLAQAGPSASMVLEARYNRALVLRDLGRHAEARAALTPFAEGDYGAYRRDDAARLIERLP